MIVYFLMYFKMWFLLNHLFLSMFFLIYCSGVIVCCRSQLELSGKNLSLMPVTPVLLLMMTMIVLLLLSMSMLGRLLDVKVWRGEGGGLSDHFWWKLC